MGIFGGGNSDTTTLTVGLPRPILPGMKLQARQLVLVVTFALCAALPTEVRAETETIDLKALAKKARPAVMLLVVSDANGKEIATGTGFLVSSDGKLITNHHVIEGAASAVAKSENGGLFPVEGVLVDDPKNDLVVLKLKGKDLSFLPLGDSEKIEVGTRIAVIGSPLGLEGTLSEGVVSAVRDLMGDTRFLQITAAISPGSSGSPVLDANGQVIGVATSLIRSGQALNFAVPAGPARALVASSQKASAVQALGVPPTSDTDAIFSDPDYQLALVAEASKDYVEVLKRNQSLVHRYPDNAMAHFCLGVAYGNLNFTDDAIAAYHKAIKLKPDYAEAWYNLGVVFDNSGHTDEAIAAYRQAIRLKPDYAKAWNNLGTCYCIAGRTDDAIAAFRQAIKLKPDDAEAWSNLGVTFYDSGRTEDAIAAYRQAINLKPDLAQAWYNLGNISSKSGRTDDAIAAYRQAIKLKPDYAKAWNGLGVAYMKAGQSAQALEAVSELRKLDPEAADKIAGFLRSKQQEDENPITHRNAARSLMAKGDLQGAVAECTKVLELHPNSLLAYEVLCGRATAYSAMDDLDKAIRDFSSAIEIKTYLNLAGPYNARAWALYKKGDLDRALADADRAIEAQSDYAEAYGTRGWIKFAKGDVKHAVADLKRAVKLAHGSQEAYIDEGMLHFIAHEYAEAVDVWNRAIKIWPVHKNELEPWIKKAQEHAIK